jgi:hypothetical protein
MYKYQLSKTVRKFLDKRDRAFLLTFNTKLIAIRENPTHPAADVQPYIGHP